MRAQPRCSVSPWPRATPSLSSVWTPRTSCSSQGPKVGAPCTGQVGLGSPLGPSLLTAMSPTSGLGSGLPIPGVPGHASPRSRPWGLRAALPSRVLRLLEASQVPQPVCLSQHLHPGSSVISAAGSHRVPMTGPRQNQRNGTSRKNSSEETCQQMSTCPHVHGDVDT